MGVVFLVSQWRQTDKALTEAHNANLLTADNFIKDQQPCILTTKVQLLNEPIVGGVVGARAGSGADLASLTTLYICGAQTFQSPIPSAQS